MRSWIVIGFLLPLSLSAQYFSIREVHGVDSWDQESVFPEVIPPEHKSASPEWAATKINTVLQYRMLSTVYDPGNEDKNIFSEVFPPEGEIGGQSEFSYDVNVNNGKLFSITISYAGTGAYTEYYSSDFNFLTETGEYIQLSDLFTPESADQLGEIVSDIFASEIRYYLDTLTDADEFANEKREMYEDCLNWFNGSGFPSSTFYLKDSSIVFTAERCSNHMMAALDDLWEFSTEMRFSDIEPYLSEKGAKILHGKYLSFSGDQLLPENKVLSGYLDGKYPITAIFSSLSGSYLNGVYWYNKYKKPIALYGEVMDNGKMKFHEEVNGKKIAVIECEWQNNQLMGVWEKADGSVSYPLVLRVE